MHYILLAIVVVIVLYILFKAAKAMIKILLVVFILLIAYFTNPDDDAHKHAFREKARDNHAHIDASTVHRRDLKIISFSTAEGSWFGIGAFTKVWIVGW